MRYNRVRGPLCLSRRYNESLGEEFPVDRLNCGGHSIFHVNRIQGLEQCVARRGDVYTLLMAQTRIFFVWEWYVNTR